MEEKVRYCVKVQNPQILNVYGIPKIRRLKNSKRLIISTIKTPTDNLDKHVVTTFSF